MHDIEPHFQWIDAYIASEDERSPLYGREYDEFYFTNTIYNYYIHPQWDEFGSATLYLKILYADYDLHYAIIELIGEWNDCIYNDIMSLRREITDLLQEEGITKFILIVENVLNYHAAEDNSYYEEWYDEISDREGWVAIVNPLTHVENEMANYGLTQYVHLLSGAYWRANKPRSLLKWVEQQLSSPKVLPLG
ncbi:MAG: hypothetical protein M3R25_09160 [Bacteroidota bacterium]|nr:hypothetical protein [Bacteroidota bacterium]